MELGEQAGQKTCGKANSTARICPLQSVVQRAPGFGLDQQQHLRQASAP